MPSFLCSAQAGEKYGGYCLHCYMYLFPDKPVSRDNETKDCAVVDYMKTQFPEKNWIADRIVSNGCS